ncbi:PstS family phosphate ABC transporter substrate-binding protein [Spirulina sp. CS-785/01]|uniref:PstS family phosphate ABC transporter substrate-binding protein n=1 Tax=Spirulina sp. CS-785/01 TaxID=3021716 RepID=UPI00232FC6FE|nr:PstS family phosphate ABC transporter substrate-binding protein [Spirulina sp. CS-785/01]MDB9315755.1 PstS family phosphate ABC transporter substrate-binding protein [Spirulina sp. CS-785/01]
MTLRRLPIRLFSLGLALALAACTSSAPTGEEDTAASDSGDGGEAQLEGDVQIDGSSTVFPISEAMAEEFMADNRGARVTVGVSGSGGGFKKFCAGETDISNASRPIKETEIELCAENGIEYVEIPVAYDGISVIVNDENDWAECLAPDQLGMMWEPDAEGEVNNWNQVKDDYPDQELSLYGPGVDSGTYDYFTEAVVGEDGESRGDYTASEDDNVIVQGVQSDEGGLGFLGFAYFDENRDTLKAVSVENSAGECIPPSRGSIADGTYNPLSRPIFFYVKKDSLENNPVVAAFAEYQISADNKDLITEVGYIPLPEEIVDKAIARLEDGTTGSIFEGGTSIGVKLGEKL